MPSAFDLFCEENYVPAWREARQAEAERRAEAFFDVARPVAGIPLRPLTPADLHILDSFRSPFVVGDPAAATAEHVASVLWLLRYRRSRLPFAFRFHRRILLRRWRAPGAFPEDLAALSLWFEDAFADAGGPRESGEAHPREPIGVHFLASLLVALACEIGPLDPSTGRPLVETPLPRLFQYQKILRVRREGSDFLDFNAADKVKSAAVNAWNALSPEDKARWQERVAALYPAPAA